MSEPGNPDDLVQDLRDGLLKGRVFGGSQDKLTATMSRLRNRAVSKLEGRQEEAEHYKDRIQIGRLRAQIERIRNEKLHSMRHTRMTEITVLLMLQGAARFYGHKTLGMVMHYYQTSPAGMAGKLRYAKRQRAQPMSMTSWHA